MDFLQIVESNLRSIPNLVITYLPSIVLALAIFIFGRIIVRKLSKGTEGAIQRLPNIDLTLAKFFASVVFFVGMMAVFVLTLSALKINLAFVATILAAVVVALGFALQDTLGDLASGIMLAFFRPFSIGQEVIVGGEKGVVKDVGLFTTRLITRDNIMVNVGNGNVFGNTITNFYANGDRRLDMDVGVSYDADLNTAIKAILSVADKDERIKSEPAPWAKVTGLGDSSVDIQLRVWCHADDHRKIQMELSKYIKQALDAAGVEIPYEHNTIIKKKG